jgi:hypothetical protein
MTRFGILGVTALSLSFAIATPVLAQQAPGRAGGHAAAGHMGAAHMGGGARMGGGMQSGFRGAQANTGGANFAARGNAQFARGNPQFARGDRGVNGGGEFRDRSRGFGRGAAFAAGAAAAGIATGAAVAAGDYGYGYSDPYYYGDNYAYGSGYTDPGYYGDSYAYDTGATYDTGLPLVTFNQPAEGTMVGDASSCAQRYRSYDPASGTYLGYDGLRHPCM